MRRAQTLAFAALFLAAFANPGQSAELPSQAKKAAAPEPATKAMKCNISGVAGVLAANGVCVRLSGSISAEFGAGHLK